MNNDNNNNDIHPDGKQVSKKLMSILKVVGIILLILIGIPALILGVCILVLRGF